jgi:hypothetical protein
MRAGDSFDELAEEIPATCYKSSTRSTLVSPPHPEQRRRGCVYHSWLAMAFAKDSMSARPSWR